MNKTGEVSDGAGVGDEVITSGLLFCDVGEKVRGEGGCAAAEEGEADGAEGERVGEDSEVGGNGRTGSGTDEAVGAPVGKLGGRTEGERGSGSEEGGSPGSSSVSQP